MEPGFRMPIHHDPTRVAIPTREQHMADEPTGTEPAATDAAEQNQDPAATEPTGAETEPDLATLKAEVDKWKGLARKHESNAKSNADAAKKYAEFEDSQKTEQQRLNDKLAAAEVELAQYRVATIRQDAAREAGLDPDLAEYITEVEPEKALEQAKRLAARIKPADPNPADMRQGARQTAKPGLNPDDWIRQSFGVNR